MIQTPRQIVAFLIVLQVVALVAVTSAAPLRKWTSANGKFTVNAELVGFSKTSVRLKTEDGREIDVLLEKLSREDRKYLEEPRSPATSKVTIREIRNFVAHKDKVFALDVFANGKYVITAGHDHVLKLWNTETGTLIREYSGHTDSIGCVAVSPDGKQAVSGSWDRTMRLWDIEMGKELNVYRDHRYPVLTVAFAPDGRHVMSGSDDFRIWDLEEDFPLRSFTGHPRTVWSVTFSPDSKRGLSGSWDETMRLWDLTTGKELRQFEGHTGRVKCVRFSPDGKLAVSGATGGNEVRLWNLETGKLVHQLEGHENGVACVAYSPNGRWIVSGSGQMGPNGGYDEAAADNSVRVWNAETGKEVAKLKNHNSFVTAIDFSKDGKVFATSSCDETVRIWEISE